MLDKEVSWSRGTVFHDDRLLYEFNLQPEDGHAFPAFINLQQPWFEKFPHDAICRAQAEGAPALRMRYLGDCPGGVYLIRPGQHVAASWDHYDETAVATALARALGKA
jgi:hypothetical protein